MSETTSSADAAFDEKVQRASPMRWMGWRLRGLALVALLGLLAVMGFMRLLAGSPQVGATWQIAADGAWVLQASPDAALQAHAGQQLLALTGADGQRLALDPGALQRPPRWSVDDAQRGHDVALQRQLATALAGGSVRLDFGPGGIADTAARPRGYAGLGVAVWVLATLAALLIASGAVVALARPTAGDALYLLMALAQAGNLLLLAVETLPGLGRPLALAGLGIAPRAALDLVTAAAALHAAALLKPRQPGWRLVTVVAWAGTALAVLALGSAALPGGREWAGAWWWTQAPMLGFGLCALAVLGRASRAQPHPHARLLRRLTWLAVGALALLTLAVALAHALESQRGSLGASAPVAVATAVWSVFLAALLLLLPFLSRARRTLREFAMLASIGTVATSLDLVMVAVFSLGQMASLTLTVVLALAAYASARQWLLELMAGGERLDIERTFEQLFIVAREVQAQPDRHAALLLTLLRDLFEPLEVLQVERATPRSRVVDDGAMLLVPMPAPPGAAGAASASGTGDDDGRLNQHTMALRYARRGKRMFSFDDARLTDRIVEQLRRAVAYDKAVERGRSEERMRIAQDLHDDIGARLLTLMYQAPTPAMEEYIRHTLQDLKTLTRGLAAVEHRLSWASAEWKADIAHRLEAAHMQLDWSFEFDGDMPLGVVQWSALTRVLRELVSNAIYHAHAQQVWIAGGLRQGRLVLRVADDGQGRDPAAWSHGLGLGGVRKRVKTLGGTVSWFENVPRGIVCEVVVPDLAARA